MTEHKELIAQLRMVPTTSDPDDQWRLTPVWVLEDAADALEALAKEKQRLREQVAVMESDLSQAFWIRPGSRSPISKQDWTMLPPSADPAHQSK